MGMKQSLDVTERQRQELFMILETYLPDTEVWAFGSRIKGAARPVSDLDLVAFASGKQRSNIAELREAFDESDLPFRVDLHIWNELPESFHKNIEIEYVPLQKTAANN